MPLKTLTTTCDQTDCSNCRHSVHQSLTPASAKKLHLDVCFFFFSSSSSTSFSSSFSFSVSFLHLRLLRNLPFLLLWPVISYSALCALTYLLLLLSPIALTIVALLYFCSPLRFLLDVNLFCTCKMLVLRESHRETFSLSCCWCHFSARLLTASTLIALSGYLPVCLPIYNLPVCL